MISRKSLVHAQLAHLARQRVAPPSKQSCSILASPTGTGQRSADQHALKLRQRCVEEATRPRIELPLRPVGKELRPVVRGAGILRWTPEVGRNVAGRDLSPGREDGEAT